MCPNAHFCLRLEQSKAESLTRFAMDELIAGDQVAGAELLELADALLSDPFKQVTQLCCYHLKLLRTEDSQEMGTRLVAQENARLLAVNNNAFEAAAVPPVPEPEPVSSVSAVPAAVTAAPASVAVVHAPQQLNAAAAAAQRGRQAQGGSVGLVQGLINQVGGLDGILKGLPPVLLGLVAIIALWKLLTSKVCGHLGAMHCDILCVGAVVARAQDSSCGANGSRYNQTGDILPMTRTLLVPCCKVLCVSVCIEIPFLQLMINET